MSRRVPFPKYGRGIGLHRTLAIARRMGVDPASFADRACVIVGSNGKGSTAAMTQAVLTAHGGPTALFTSPHLSRLNERYRLDDRDIDDALLDRCWAKAEAAILAHQGEYPDDLAGGFEFLFLVALNWLDAVQPRFVVLEAGVGGRYDPTRLIRSGRAALVSLDLEHTALLGDTLAAIAFDKLEVCRPGGLVLSGAVDADVYAQMTTHADLIRIEVDRVAEGSAWRPAGDGIEITLVSGEVVAAVPPLHGAAQAGNTALAVRLAESLAGPLDADRIRTGLAATRWPGRLETVSTDPLAVVDVGHTPKAIDAALEGLDRLAAGRVFDVLVCGASRDKAAPAMIAQLAPRFAHVICTAARHKGESPARIAEAARTANPTATVSCAATPEEAWALARASVAPGHGVYVAGGLFLAMEVAAVIRGQPLVDPFF